MDRRYGKDEIRPIQKGEAETLVTYIEKHIRPEDKEEIEAFQRNVQVALMESLSLSTEAYQAVDENGLPFMIFGYAKPVSQIWAIGTKDAEKHKRTIVLCGRDYIHRCKETYGYMENWISENNKKALHYIERAGAIFTDKITSETGVTFIKFEIGERR